MRRRTFIQSLATAGAWGLPLPGSLAQLVAAAPTGPRPLLQLYDRLPAAPPRPEPVAPGPAAGLFPVLLDDNEFLGYCPLLLGLGPAAEALVRQAQAGGLASDDAGLYCTCGTEQPPAASTAPLDRRLRHCASALLVIDGQDPQALIEGLHWAERLERAEVTLRAALVAHPVATPGFATWRSALRKHLHAVLELSHSVGTLPPTASALTLLHNLPFLPASLVCIDLSDLRQVLLTGPQARTTAVRWRHPGRLPAAVTQACRPSDPPRHGGGALAWLHGGSDLQLSEFDAVGHQLRRHLADEAPLVLGVAVQPSWGARRRALSLTRVGDWS